MNHFERVLPIVGESLSKRRIALLGINQGFAVAELLAACGALDWVLLDDFSAAERLIATFQHQHGTDLPWRFTCAPPDDPAALAGCALLLAAGDEALIETAQWLSHEACCPLLALPNGGAWPALCPDTGRGYVVQQLPDQHDGFLLPPQPARNFAAAALARALLLRDSAYGRPDLDALLLAAPKSTLMTDLPFLTPRNTPLLRERTALVVGCGSLGSFAADALAPLVGRLMLVDPGNVTAANPVRQRLPVGRVGQPKATALADELRSTLGPAAPDIEPIIAGPTGDEAEAWIATLAARVRPDMALLLTGTSSDLAYARGLRAAGVPHLAARCYPRARFWEAIVVPDADAPCLGCLRGQLYTGPVAPPTPEEAERYTTSHDLTGEPATRVESGWAAACAADLALQMLVPPGLRERWFIQAVAHNQTCFLGGAYVIATSDPLSDQPACAYGIEQPGAVQTYGLNDVLGSAATRICADCGRHWPTRFLL